MRKLVARVSWAVLRGDGSLPDVVWLAWAAFCIVGAVVAFLILLLN